MSEQGWTQGAPGGGNGRVWMTFHRTRKGEAGGRVGTESQVVDGADWTEVKAKADRLGLPTDEGFGSVSTP